MSLNPCGSTQSWLVPTLATHASASAAIKQRTRFGLILFPPSDIPIVVVYDTKRFCQTARNGADSTAMVERKQLALHKKMPTTPRTKPIEDRQALALHQVISALMREFRLEPGLLAGSAYADLHANDIALFEVLSGPGEWNVRSVAQAISVPITTVSSALDRLERKGLIARYRIPEDRRIVRLSLTAHGRRLAVSLEKTHIDNCRAMLARLGAKDREQFLDLAAKLTSE